MEERKMVEEGKAAPEFTLSGSDGKTHSLSEFKGKKVVLYFYPKDNTSGCTKEACSLRDNAPAIEGKDAVVIGISRDSESSHRKFIEKNSLSFLLLSDPDHSVSSLYGAWGEKTMYGKKVEGALRKTFIIDEGGIITKIFAKVNTSTHGVDVQGYL